MKTNTLTLISALTLLLTACGGSGPSKVEQIKAQTSAAVEDPYDNWKEYHGVGPVQPFTLPAEVDQALAAKGHELFEAKCTACHKTDKKFIGPAPKGVLTRRNPEWVMNMILVPDKMILEDPIAKKLLMEFNGSPMANQSLTEDEARAVLEYFRTL